ncbi:MAG: hypothetical protein VXZ53_17095 [Planctomycetota bacterium]|nr:hypothetical protein [Planctomycetota bacterium]MEC8508699.1 hypothetical protein [Planctomycetota bacterium]MEC8862145.1 hypothetical protein [Planctomycetota bacterium]
MSRRLTEEENRILEMIRSYYGLHNTTESIIWVNGNEATLGVTDDTGTKVLMANLTNLATLRVDGIIKNDEVLKRDWLRMVITDGET